MNLRIGNGYDIHRLETNRPLVIGGVTIDFEKGLLGHSDADVLTHAIIDALFGASALGDIGTHYPDNNLAYKAINSMILLTETEKRLTEANYKILNIDSIVIAEKPKLSSYIPQMRDNIAKNLKINIDQVSIKAKTSEGIGEIGQCLAIESRAVVLIEKINAVVND